MISIQPPNDTTAPYYQFIGRPFEYSAKANDNIKYINRNILCCMENYVLLDNGYLLNLQTNEKKYSKLPVKSATSSSKFFFSNSFIYMNIGNTVYSCDINNEKYRSYDLIGINYTLNKDNWIAERVIVYNGVTDIDDIRIITFNKGLDRKIYLYGNNGILVIIVITNNIYAINVEDVYGSSHTHYINCLVYNDNMFKMYQYNISASYDSVTLNNITKTNINNTNTCILKCFNSADGLSSVWKTYIIEDNCLYTTDIDSSYRIKYVIDNAYKPIESNVICYKKDSYYIIRDVKKCHNVNLSKNVDKIYLAGNTIVCIDESIVDYTYESPDESPDESSTLVSPASFDYLLYYNRLKKFYNTDYINGLLNIRRKHNLKHVLKYYK